MKNLICLLTASFLLLGCQGPTGISSLTDISRVHVSPEICLSEMGVLIQSGLDYNRDLHLQDIEIMKSSIICDGKNGTDGVDGTNGQDGEDAPISVWSIVKIYDPCGDEPGKVDEVIVEYSNGAFMAWYKNVGLVLLDREVNYVTTDAQKCKFKITSEGSVEEL